MSPSDASNAVKPLRPARLPAYNAASASACSVSIAHSDLVKFASPILTLQPNKSVCTLPAAEALHRLVHFIGRSMRKNDGEFISPNAVSAILHSKRAEQGGERREHPISRAHAHCDR